MITSEETTNRKNSSLRRFTKCLKRKKLLFTELYLNYLSVCFLLHFYSANGHIIHLKDGKESRQMEVKLQKALKMFSLQWTSEKNSAMMTRRSPDKCLNAKKY
jgi:hypothetical protein